MTRLVIPIAVLLASSQVSAEQLPSAAGTAEDLRLMQAYGNCTFEEARRLLDIDPSAAVVAEAAHDACEQEWDAWRALWHASDDRHDSIEAVFEGYKSHYMNGLTAVVEQFRAGR